MEEKDTSWTFCGVFDVYSLEKREVVLLIIPRENGLLALHFVFEDQRSKRTGRLTRLSRQSD